MEQKSNRGVWLKIIISIVSIIIIIVHWIWPCFTLDSATLVLLFFAILPWVFPILKSIEIPGGWKFEFLDRQDDKGKDQVVKQVESSTKDKIDWDKVATLFWLGNDLMWIKDMIFRGKPPEKILQGVNHALEYVKDLGFDEKSMPVQNLNLSKMRLEAIVGIDPSGEHQSTVESHYSVVNDYVNQVKWYVEAVAKTKQPEFKKLRD